MILLRKSNAVMKVRIFGLRFYIFVQRVIWCNKMVYVSVNKNSGNYIILKGKTLLDSKQNFKGYSFKNGVYEYNIFRNNVLQISKNNSILQEIKLRDCQ